MPDTEEEGEGRVGGLIIETDGRWLSEDDDGTQNNRMKKPNIKKTSVNVTSGGEGVKKKKRKSE